MTAPVKVDPAAAPPAPPAPPTPSPAATPTSPPAPQSPFAKLSADEKDRLLSVYSGTIQNQKEQLEELGARVKKVETRQDAPPPVDSKVANADFYNRPMEMVTEIVRKEVAAAIEPLTTFVRTAGARDEYSTIKDELRNDPRVKAVFDGAERHIDEFIRKQAAGGTKITRDLVIAAVAGVKGAQELGWIEGGGNGAPAPAPTPAPTPPTPSPTSMFTPPHLRPSAPPAPGPNDAAPKLRDLDEREERLRRENGMTKEEFLAALDMAAGDVVRADAWPKREPAKQPGGMR